LKEDSLGFFNRTSVAPDLTIKHQSSVSCYCYMAVKSVFVPVLSCSQYFI